jgi:hypothetical protein
METTRSIDLPATPPAGVVTETQVENSYDWIDARLQQVENAALDERSDRPVVRDRIELRAHLDIHAPSEVDADLRSRLQALREHRQLSEELGYLEADTELFDQESVRTELADQVDAFSVQYRGDTAAAVIVNSGYARQQYEEALQELDRPHETDDTDQPRWAQVRTAQWHLQQAQQFNGAATEPTRQEALAAAFGRLDAAIEEVFSESRLPNHAHELWVNRFRPRPSGWMDRFPRGQVTAQERFDKGQTARATQLRAWAHATALTLDSFSSVLPYYDWEHYDPPAIIDSTAALIDRKQAAVDELQSVRDQYGADPLAAFLVSKAVAKLAIADRRLRELVANPQSIDGTEWQQGRAITALLYEQQRQFAEAIPDTVDLVRS